MHSKGGGIGMHSKPEKLEHCHLLDCGKLSQRKNLWEITQPSYRLGYGPLQFELWHRIKHLKKVMSNLMF